VPLWFDSPREQAAQVFPDDPHLQRDGGVIDYVRAHTAPGTHILVVWSAANVYYLSNRPPAIPYMWYRNIQVIPGALDEVHAALASPDRPALVIEEDSPDSLDSSGETSRLLAEHYRRVATVNGVPIYGARSTT